MEILDNVYIQLANVVDEAQFRGYRTRAPLAAHRAMHVTLKEK